MRHTGGRRLGGPLTAFHFVQAALQGIDLFHQCLD
jgi:hypothetical protein